jgi:hypothetical protein
MWMAGKAWLPPDGWGNLLAVGAAGLAIYGLAVLIVDRGLRTDAAALLATLRWVSNRWRKPDHVAAPPVVSDGP